MSDLTPTGEPRRRFRPYRLYSQDELRAARRKRTVMSTLSVLVLALIVASYGWIYYNSFFERSGEAVVGTQSTELVAKVAGKVSRVVAAEGQPVKAGDVLVQLDPKEQQAALDESQRALESSDKKLEGAGKYLFRMREAAAKGSDADKQKYEAARKWYSHLAKQNQELRARMNEAKTHVRATAIVAPATGHLGRALVAAGQTVGEGQPVAEFVGETPPWVVAQYKPSQVAKMHVGSRAVIYVAPLHKSFEGRVESLPEVPQPPAARSSVEAFLSRFTSGTPRVPVRIAFDPKSLGDDVNRLTNGARADVKVYIK